MVWVLSFVLAPYTHILSQATPKTDAHRFIEGVMPRLLEQSHNQQVASLQEASGTPPSVSLSLTTRLSREHKPLLKLS